MANKWDERKKAQEDEYFVKKERELIVKLKAKLHGLTSRRGILQKSIESSETRKLCRPS